MESKEILRLVVLIALCMILESTGCEEERMVACHRPNMTCLRQMCYCLCNCRAPIETYYHRYVKCSNVTEVPKEIPNEAEEIIIVGNNITTLKRGDFSNIPYLFRLRLSGNKINHIEPGSFINLTFSYGLILHLEYNNLSRITAFMFRDISISHLYLEGNPITVIERHAFLHLSLLRRINGIRPFLVEIETEAFVKLSANPLLLDLTGNNVSVIQKNAFMFVTFDYLMIGIAENFKMEENSFMTITNLLNFSGDFIQCNCDLMWLLYFLRRERPFAIRGAKCENINKTVSALVPEDFNCIDIASPVQFCNVSHSIDLQHFCEYNYLTASLKRLIHTRNGRFIRDLNHDLIDKDINTLHFSFCNHDDSGEYTCLLTTDYPEIPSINKSLHLVVNGPPVVLNQYIEAIGDDLILSVVFYTMPYEFNLQWLLGKNDLNGDSQYSITINNMTVILNQYNVDVTTRGFISNLTIHNFKSLQSAVYRCIISNSYGLVVEQIVSGPVNIELERRKYCNTSYSIELKCTLDLVGATAVPWVHSNAGETIRVLEGKHTNNSNVLNIPFCNSQDTGDYTCGWKTDISDHIILEKYTTLSVSGPPFIISHSISVEGSDTVLSVTFFSQPFPRDPMWHYNNEPVALGSQFLQTTTYSPVQVRQHRVIVNQEGFISNLTVPEAGIGVYKCVILNSFGQAHQLFVIEQGQNMLSISTTESTRSPKSPGESTTFIIAICSIVFGIAILVICIIIFIRRNSAERYNSTVQTRNEDNCYDTINMTTPPHVPDNQQDYLEVF